MKLFEAEKIATELRSAKKHAKSYDNLVLAKFMVFLIPLLIFAVASYALECPYCLEPLELQAFVAGRTPSEDGVFWRCQGCGKRVWSNNADWQGCYYCPACDTQAINPQRCPSNGPPGTPKRR